MRTIPRLELVLAALLLGLGIAAGLWAWERPARPVERHALGLVTSLPIYWPEAAEFALLPEADAPLPWVRRTLEQRYDIVPLDSLGAGDGSGPIPDLARLDRLLVAQPRGLSPLDNAALDQWVRGGGRLLYVLDPMLTGEYDVPLGDPRHPVTVGLVPPVVGRWGLAVRFFERQPLEVRLADYGAGSLPVLLAGEIFTRELPADADGDAAAARGDCRILGDGIMARCAVGAGSVTLVADAALFELAAPLGEAEAQLLALVGHAFGD